jgi:hypothetical protein
VGPALFETFDAELAVERGVESPAHVKPQTVIATSVIAPTNLGFAQPAHVVGIICSPR